MNEVWRVLKPNGIFKDHTPDFPKQESLVDPTPVNFITEQTVNYFCGGEYTNLSKSNSFDACLKKSSLLG